MNAYPPALSPTLKFALWTHVLLLIVGTAIGRRSSAHGVLRLCLHLGRHR